MGLFFSQPQFPAFKLPTPPSASIDIMSVYQPFPLRVDSFGEKGKQYDACFQIGEFPSDHVPGTNIVILIPLKVSPNPGVGGTFVNAFASKIPNILGAQPDPLQGYPDVPAQTGATWDVSKVVKVDRPYYTWQNSNGTRVIVMAEPILIAQGDMTNIQRLPVTPPEDVIHEIGSPILYKPAPPVDANGNAVPCPKPTTGPAAASAAAAAIAQPPVVVNKPAVDTDLFLQVLLGIVGTIAVIIGVWFGIKLASGPVGVMLKKLGDSLGSSLAGGYGAIKKARSGTANVLGIGQTGSLPPPRTIEQIAEAPAPAGTPAAVADISPKYIPEPTSNIDVINPGYKSKDDFISRHKTLRNAKPTIRTPAQIAQAPVPRGNISPVNLPEPSGEFSMINPGYKSKADFASRHTTRKNIRKPVVPSVAAVANATEPFPDTPAPAPAPAPSVAAIANATEPFPDAPVQPTSRRTTPISAPEDYKMTKNPMIKPKRRKIAAEPEDEEEKPSLARTASIANRLKRASTRARDSLGDFDRAVETTPTSNSEERIARKAAETALPRTPGMPRGSKSTGADTGLFGSRALREGLGVKEKEERSPNATIFGGKRRRRHRMKTGRRV